MNDFEKSIIRMLLTTWGALRVPYNDVRKTLTEELGEENAREFITLYGNKYPGR